MAKRNANMELNHGNWKEEEGPQEAAVFVQADNKTMEGRVIRKAKRRGVEMTVSTSKFEIQTCLDKKLTNFDEKKCRDLDKYPVNFSGVPHIGAKIFGFLDFKDLNNCNDVCKGWQNFLQEKRVLWIELLEKEKIKLERSENYGLDDSDGSSDCSDDSSSSDDHSKWEIHDNVHDPDDMFVVGGRDPMDMSDEEAEFNDGYVTTTF